MNRLIRVALGAAAAAIAVGCNGGHMSFHYYDDRPVVERRVVHQPVVVERTTVVVPSGHICNHHCDHYYDGAVYYRVVKGHVHGPGCGHDLVTGRWVVVGKARSSEPPPPRPTTRRVTPTRR